MSFDILVFADSRTPFFVFHQHSLSLNCDFISAVAIVFAKGLHSLIHFGVCLFLNLLLTSAHAASLLVFWNKRSRKAGRRRVKVPAESLCVAVGARLCVQLITEYDNTATRLFLALSVARNDLRM